MLSTSRWFVIAEVSVLFDVVTNDSLILACLPELSFYLLLSNYRRRCIGPPRSPKDTNQSAN